MGSSAIQHVLVGMVKFFGEQRVARMNNLNAWIKCWDPKQYHDAYGSHLQLKNAAI